MCPAGSNFSLPPQPTRIASRSAQPGVPAGRVAALLSAWPVSFSVQLLHDPIRPPSPACATISHTFMGGDERMALMRVSFGNTAYASGGRPLGSFGSLMWPEVGGFGTARNMPVSLTLPNSVASHLHIRLELRPCDVHTKRRMQVRVNKNAGGTGAAVRAARSLTVLKRGESGILERIELPADDARRLMELGFLPGHTVTRAHSAPGGDARGVLVDVSGVA